MGRFMQNKVKPKIQKRIQEREDEARRQEENRIRFEGLSELGRRKSKENALAR
jgi:hypothetical protein